MAADEDAKWCPNVVPSHWHLQLQDVGRGMKQRPTLNAVSDQASG